MKYIDKYTVDISPDELVEVLIKDVRNILKNEKLRLKK